MINILNIHITFTVFLALCTCQYRFNMVACGTPFYGMARKYQSKGLWKWWPVVKVVHCVILFVGVATWNFKVAKYWKHEISYLIHVWTSCGVRNNHYITLTVCDGQGKVITTAHMGIKQIPSTEFHPLLYKLRSGWESRRGGNGEDDINKITKKNPQFYFTYITGHGTQYQENPPNITIMEQCM